MFCDELIERAAEVYLRTKPGSPFDLFFQALTIGQTPLGYPIRRTRAGFNPWAASWVQLENALQEAGMS